MNPADVEKTFAAALRRTVTTTLVLQGTGNVELPDSESFIVVFAEQCENVVGPLWKTTVAVNIISPAPLLEPATHTIIVTQTVNAMISDTFFSLYNANAPLPPADHHCVGGKLLNTEGEADNGAFRHTVKILLGLVVGRIGNS